MMIRVKLFTSTKNPFFHRLEKSYMHSIRSNLNVVYVRTYHRGSHRKSILTNLCQRQDQEMGLEENYTHRIVSLKVFF